MAIRSAEKQFSPRLQGVVHATDFAELSFLRNVGTCICKPDDCLKSKTNAEDTALFFCSTSEPEYLFDSQVLLLIPNDVRKRER
jgi:hypothetical protein